MTCSLSVFTHIYMCAEICLQIRNMNMQKCLYLLYLQFVFS